MSDFTKACTQHLINKGFFHAGLSSQEMREKIEEYRIQYEYKKKKKAEAEAKLEAKRRHEFIYGRIYKHIDNRPL